jgi:Arc-like DNA binding dprotein
VPDQQRVCFAARFTAERHAKLKAEADKHGRSVSEEVEARVERSFSNERLAEIKRGVDQVGTDLQSIAAELIEKIAERLVKIEQAQALNQEAIERGVTQALAKARFTIGGENT